MWLRTWSTIERRENNCKLNQQGKLIKIGKKQEENMQLNKILIPTILKPALKQDSKLTWNPKIKHNNEISLSLLPSNSNFRDLWQHEGMSNFMY